MEPRCGLADDYRGGRRRARRCLIAMIPDRAIEQPEAEPAANPPVDAPSKIARLTSELIVVREMLAVANARLSQYERPADWKSVKNAATDGGVRYETVRRWAAKGLIISEKRGGSVRVDFNSVLARLERMRSG
jgi:hypothetical protein